MPVRPATLTRCTAAIPRKSLRRCALAALTVAALAWPTIGNAQLAIHVQGNQFVNQNGAVVHLRGVDYSGTEYACVGGGDGNGDGYAIFQGPDQTDANFIAALKSWHINTIRLPLNEDCWLGINLPGDNQYSGAAYRTAIENFVQALNNEGVYIILDLHWNAPGTYVANQQLPMADQDHSPAFWSSVAAAFAHVPGVIFDLYNEPYVGSWGCWLSGCSVTNSDGTWTTAGMAALVTAVREAGATQPIMLGGLSYAGDLSQWSANLPSDPVQGPPQLVASYHSYCGPPGTSTVGECQGEIPGLESSEWPPVQTIASSYPVVTGELGEYDCATTYVYTYMDFADQNGISYVGWSFNTDDCRGGPSLIGNSYDSPTVTAYGMGLYDHLAALRRLHATHDFSGEGTSDILWRDTSGNLAMWLMSAGQFSSGAMIARVPATWSVVASRDFTGTGDADILWLDGGGDLAVWLMNGPSVTSYASLGNVGTQWSVAGSGDFNGDGIADILWRNTTTGDLAIWLMNGSGQLASGVDLGTVPLVWQVAGTGDFNDDGTIDILWRNTQTGELAVWFMSSGQISSSINVGRVSTGWTVVGTGDFNDDGVSDILWRDSAGDLAIWLMSYANNSNNVTVELQMASGAQFTGIPTTWSVAGTGDFDGNGTSDILWLDGSGNLGVWFMNGLTVGTQSGLGNVGTTWRVQGQNAD